MHASGQSSITWEAVDGMDYFVVMAGVHKDNDLGGLALFPIDYELTFDLTSKIPPQT
jgi:hypothetical protein